MREEKPYEWFFETLANPLRMRIVRRLMEKDRTVQELVALTGAEQSKVSHALAVLKDCRVVRSRTEGRFRRYEANREMLVPLFALVDSAICARCQGCLRAEAKSKARG